MLLNERLRELLEVQMKTTPQLARYVNVTPQCAHKWVTGQSEPRSKVKPLIAQFFGLSVQQLEYGPLVLLTESKPELTKVDAALSNTLAEHSANLMIEAELKQIGQRSPEYISGMKDYLLFKLTGTVLACGFSPGTCQRDAYEAGYAHGKILVSELPHS